MLAEMYLFTQLFAKILHLAVVKSPPKPVESSPSEIPLGWGVCIGVAASQLVICCGAWILCIDIDNSLDLLASLSESLASVGLHPEDERCQDDCGNNHWDGWQSFIEEIGEFAFHAVNYIKSHTSWQLALLLGSLPWHLGSGLS